MHYYNPYQQYYPHPNNSYHVPVPPSAPQLSGMNHQHSHGLHSKHNKKINHNGKQDSSQKKGNKEQTGNQDDKQENKKKKQQKPAALISFDTLRVGSISSSSGVFNGKNIQFGWSSHSKSNTGFGTVSGNDNHLNENTNVVFDNDQVDTPIDDRDTMWSPIPTTTQ